MHRNHGPVYYGDYLKLDQLLDTQQPLSRKYGDECHDETLFIIVHQVYELWFKQILHELRSVVEAFSSDKLEESKLGLLVGRLERINKIQSLLMDQLEVMETMTPMDFLEFRDLLVPASGFQSTQFREIEIRMGLRTDKRKSVDQDFFLGRLSEKDRNQLLEIEKQSSLLELIESWLERMPFTQSKDFDFWQEYQKAVDEMLVQEKSIIDENAATLSEKQRSYQLANLESTRETFDGLFDEKVHKQLINKGQRLLGQKAILNALFILLYRDEPILQIPYRFLQTIMDIDEGFTTWRYRHALMAHRMLGTKIGTGGSSGHRYLKEAADKNRIFIDIFDLSTFLIPRSKLPGLPSEIKRKLDFYFHEGPV